MTLRERNLRSKIEKLEAVESPTESQARELAEAKTALGYATGETPIKNYGTHHTSAPSRGNSYTAMIDEAGDINNLLRRNGNGACAE